MSDSKKPDPLGLAQFKIPLGKVAPSQVFRTRAGFQLSYRVYPSWSEDLIVLYHGLGSDSRYLAVLASAWAAENLVTVVTPDFRGHGASFGAPDALKSDQLDQDFEELLIHLRMERSVRRLFVAGHSMGGGFALRLMSGGSSLSLSGAFAIAPYLPPILQTGKADGGGWITVEADRVIVHLDESFRLGQEKLSYSTQYMQAAVPPDNFLQRLNPEYETVVVMGDLDQVIIAEKVEQIFAEHAHIYFQTLVGANHFSIVMAPAFVKELTEILKKNFLLA